MVITVRLPIICNLSIPELIMDYALLCCSNRMTHVLPWVLHLDKKLIVSQRLTLVIVLCRQFWVLMERCIAGRPAKRVCLCCQQPLRVHHCQAARLWHNSVSQCPSLWQACSQSFLHAPGLKLSALCFGAPISPDWLLTRHLCIREKHADVSARCTDKHASLPCCEIL